MAIQDINNQSPTNGMLITCRSRGIAHPRRRTGQPPHPHSPRASRIATDEGSSPECHTPWPLHAGAR